MTESNRPTLTVVLAVKDPEPWQFNGCIASVAALRSAPIIDLVIVVSGRLPVLLDQYKVRLHSIQVVNQEPLGVYAAYNRGIDEARSTYTMMMGCDDQLLPSLDRVIDSIPTGELPHIVAASVLMQDIGVVGPSRFRWGIIFRNWCQQGLLYRTDIFANRRFDCRYPIQADHKLNMELVSDPKTVVLRRDDVICHFSSSGCSQTQHDWLFREDMPGLVRLSYGPIFWFIALTKRKLADIIKWRRL